MNITPEQARESLSARAEHLRRIAEHYRSVGAHEAAEDLGKEVDILDWAIARIAELEAQLATAPAPPAGEHNEELK